jgi:hypothetical protein
MPFCQKLHQSVNFNFMNGGYCMSSFDVEFTLTKTNENWLFAILKNSAILDFSQIHPVSKYFQRPFQNRAGFENSFNTTRFITEKQKNDSSAIWNSSAILDFFHKRQKTIIFKSIQLAQDFNIFVWKVTDIWEICLWSPFWINLPF